MPSALPPPKTAKSSPSAAYNLPAADFGKLVSEYSLPRPGGTRNRTSGRVVVESGHHEKIFAGNLLPMIKAIIFDVGGVLIRTESRAPRASLEARLALTPGAADLLV